MNPAENPPKGIALFDMDGTLLPWDCQLLFRHHVIREEPLRFFSVPLFLIFLPFAGILGTETMKRIFHGFLWKMSPERLAELSQRFAERLAPSFYEELKSALAMHRAAGHLTILSSASPECYVAAVGKLLGFDLALGTVFESNSLFPDLTNHKGKQKVTRLRTLLPATYFHDGMLINSHGYTDSMADLPMLEICDRATLVNPPHELAELAQKRRWSVLQPPRPWRNSYEKWIRIALLLFAIGKNPARL
ncbi:MAG: hypothetical protein RL346_1140 [Verrucomicrobiota bacterium]|jgi:phosphatidylglycerophosphatase C